MLSTDLIINKELANLFKIHTLYIKDESKNRFGTYKDRRSNYVRTKIIEKNIKHIVIITAGNAGYSIKNICAADDVTIYQIVDNNISSHIKKLLSGKNSIVIQTDLSKKIIRMTDYKEIIALDDNTKLWDISNGMHLAYRNIFYEIANEFPDLVIVPYGSGEAFYGIYLAIKEMKRSTKVVGVKTKKRSKSIADKLCTIWSPYDKLLPNIISQGHYIIELEEEEIKKSYACFSKYVNCEYSSSVVLGALTKIAINKFSRIILVNSGKGKCL